MRPVGFNPGLAARLACIVHAHCRGPDGFRYRLAEVYVRPVNKTGVFADQKNTGQQ
jgi:hypothetical protein